MTRFVPGVDAFNNDYIITLDEIRLLYNFLSHQYISYENPEMIKLVRELAKIVSDEGEKK